MTAAHWEGREQRDLSWKDPKLGAWGLRERKSNHDLRLNILLKDFQETLQTRGSRYTALISGIKSVRSMNECRMVGMTDRTEGYQAQAASTTLEGVSRSRTPIPIA